jgi:hypothetical protein
MIEPKTWEINKYMGIFGMPTSLVNGPDTDGTVRVVEVGPAFEALIAEVFDERHDNAWWAEEDAALIIARLSGEDRTSRTQEEAE